MYRQLFALYTHYSYTRLVCAFQFFVLCCVFVLFIPYVSFIGFVLIRIRWMLQRRHTTHFICSMAGLLAMSRLNVWCAEVVRCFSSLLISVLGSYIYAPFRLHCEVENMLRL